MKKQTRKVGVAGGFINQMMGNNSSQPKVGEGATTLSYSDRHAHEVTWVSEDGNSCKIRSMKCNWCGSGYGDERYTYESKLDGHESLLEWNAKKGQWGYVSHSVQIIKALQNKLIKEHGYDWSHHLPNGVTYKSLIVEGFECEAYPKLKLVEGITKEYRNFSPVSIIFGVMEQYRDPSF